MPHHDEPGHPGPNPTHVTADLASWADASGIVALCPDTKVSRRMTAHFAYVPGEAHPYIQRDLLDLLKLLTHLGHTRCALLSDPLRGKVRVVYITLSQQSPEG